MTFVSMYINHKLRPPYRQWGRNLGERIADAIDADPAQRERIIKRTTVATSVGLSLGCALVTADAYGLMHAAATSAHEEIVAQAATVHAQVTQSVVAAHGQVVNQAMNQAGAGPAAVGYVTPVHYAAPATYGTTGNTAGMLAGMNQRSDILASVGQDQASIVADNATSGAVDSVSDSF
jgi:hypothetical protein